MKTRYQVVPSRKLGAVRGWVLESERVVYVKEQGDVHSNLRLASGLLGAYFASQPDIIEPVEGRWVFIRGVPDEMKVTMVGLGEIQALSKV